MQLFSCVDFNNDTLCINCIKLTLTQEQLLLSTQNSVFKCDCLGGYRERETPGPIPNPEAKPLIADNTDPCRIGNVGRCLVDHF